MRVFQHLILVSLFFVATTASAQTTTRTSSSKGNMTWINSTDTEKFQVETEGEIVFRDDDSGVASISQGGILKASYQSAGKQWKLEVKPASNGSLTYQYEVDGKKMPYSASSQSDLAPFFLKIIRETGINAEVRVARILKNSGPEGIFREIEHIESGSSIVRYLIELVVQGQLNERDLIKTGELAQAEVKSSGDLSRFLMRTDSYFIEKPGARSTFFNVAESIPSSGDRARVLMGLYELSLDSSTHEQLVEVAATIPSSGDKTRVLIAGLDNFPESGKARTAYFKAAATIPSSGDQSRLLVALLSENDLDAESVRLSFDIVSSMSSSGDKARVLIKAAPMYNNSPQHRDHFFKAVSTIPSSGEHARVLIALLEENTPNASTVESILESVTHISSSGDATRVLVRTAKYINDDQVNTYLEAANTVGSQGDRGRALKALMDR